MNNSLSVRQKKLVTEEINRYRQIMGLLPLVEAETEAESESKATTVAAPRIPFPKIGFPKLRAKYYAKINPEAIPQTTAQGVKYIEYKLAGKPVSEEQYNLVTRLFNSEGPAFTSAYDDFVTKLANETEEAFVGRLKKFLTLLGPEYKNDLYSKFLRAWYEGTAVFGNNQTLRSEIGFYKWMLRDKKTAEAAGDVFDVKKWLKEKLNIDDALDLESLSEKVAARLDEYAENPASFKVEVKKIVPKKKPLNKVKVDYLKSFLGKRTAIWTSIFSKWEKTLQDYEKSVLGYVEAYTDEVARLAALDPTKQKAMVDDLSAAYAVKIAGILRKAKIKFGDEAIAILEESGIDPNILLYFKNDEDAFFRYFNEAFAGLDDASRTTFMQSAKLNMKDFVKTIYRAIVKLFSLRWYGLAREVVDPSTRLGTWYWTSTWGSFDTYYQLAAKYNIWSRNPTLAKFWGEAWLYTVMAGLIGYAASVCWEVFKELVLKTVGKMFALVCDGISGIHPAFRAHYDDTGEPVQGWCADLWQATEYEEEGWNVLLLTVPEAIYDAYVDKLQKTPIWSQVFHGIPGLAQVLGFIQNIDRTLLLFRQDVFNQISTKAEGSQKNLKNEMEKPHTSPDSNEPVVIPEDQIPELPNVQTLQQEVQTIGGGTQQ